MCEVMCVGLAHQMYFTERVVIMRNEFYCVNVESLVITILVFVCFFEAGSILSGLIIISQEQNQIPKHQRNECSGIPIKISYALPRRCVPRSNYVSEGELYST